jgi:homopolymeric O-antigen transport system ATP-binding protein
VPEDIAVTAQALGKRYRLGQRQGGYQLLTEAVTERIRHLGRSRRKRDELWALRDVSFTVRRGETFAIIGHNGAGKSTLLKILSRVTPPTAGEVMLNGRVGSLLEVGTGFHPELTGRENIYLNGAILGMRRAEIERKFDEIVDFAEVERFIDTPVKRYSSGMYLRLAFAVAAHLEPEVLIVDEVLSVGDLAFQEKCLGRMERVAGEGRTVLFVSHNLPAVGKLCDRAMLLAGGRKTFEGAAQEVVDRYVASVRTTASGRLDDSVAREGSGRLRFREVLFESSGRQVDQPVTGRDLEIILRYESANGKPIKNPTFAVAVYTTMGTRFVQCQSDVAGSAFRSVPAVGEIRVRLPRCPLPAGRYTLNLFASISGEVADWVRSAVVMTVADGDFYGSGRGLAPSVQTVLVDQEWTVTEAPVQTDEEVPSAVTT